MKISLKIDIHIFECNILVLQAGWPGYSQTWGTRPNSSCGLSLKGNLKDLYKPDTPRQMVIHSAADVDQTGQRGGLC